VRTRFIVLAVLITCLVSVASAATQRLTILHSNDVHGHLRPCSYPAISVLGSGSLIAGSMQSGSLFADLPARRDVGGIARRATLAGRIRAELARRGTPVWLVDAGDIFHYSAFSNEYHGEADMIAMSRAGYDFATFGNHEFAVTAAQLRTLIADARFEFLSANVTDSTTHRPLVKRYEVRKVGAVRVGIFGLTTSGAARAAAARGLAVEDVFQAAPAVVAQLRGREKADIVVLISHCGEDVDQQLARRVPGIDVIVGGHSHTRLPQGEMVWWSDDLKPDEVNGTVIVQAGEWGVELGRLDLLLEENAAGKWRVGRYQEHLIPVTGETPDDPAVAAVLDSLWAPYAAKYDEVLATATADFAVRGDDSPQSNLYVDAVRAASGVELGFGRGGGVHWPIVAGPVRRAMLVDLDQDQSTVLTFRMKGSEIRRFVQQARPVASGLRYRMPFGTLEAVTVGDAPLDDARTYSCAASSSLGRWLESLELLDRQDTNRLWSDVVMEAMREARTITPVYDGRRIVVDTLRVGRFQ
jgi:5'-nucleotidase